MTGEINLRGYVTAIGGLKEKLLAALRSGMKTVLIPKENEKDLADVPDKVKKNLEIIPVNTIEEVLLQALLEVPKPLDPSETAEKTAENTDISPETAENKEKDVVTH